MLKILIKKQIKELLSPFTYDKRKGKKQGVGMKVLFVMQKNHWNLEKLHWLIMQEQV